MILSRSVLERKYRANVSMDFEFNNGLLDQNKELNVGCYYGTDDKHNVLFIKIIRRKKNLIELILFLRLQDGRTFFLPNHPDTLIADGMSSWSAGGLKIKVTESSQHTHIAYNGLLRNGTWDYKKNDADMNIEHVRLNCNFVASTVPNMFRELSPWYKFWKTPSIEKTEQYGSITGKVTFENSVSQQLHLCGIRQCEWGKFDTRSFCIIGSDDLGNVFLIKSYKNLHKSIGHLKDPDDTVHEIMSMDFDVAALMEFYEGRYIDHGFTFYADHRQYVVNIWLHDVAGKTFYGGNQWNSRYDCCQLRLKLNNIPGVGILETRQPFQGATDFDTYSSKMRIEWNVYKHVDSRQNEWYWNKKHPIYILPFNDPKCLQVETVGGYGVLLAELAAMKATEFTIPKGFCVTTEAFAEHLQFNTDIRDKIVERAHASIDVEEHNKILVEKLNDSQMEPKVSQAITKALKEFESDCKFTVKMSVVGKDSEDSLAAVQNSTFSNIAKDEVEKTVIQCWASLYDHRNIKFRRRKKLPIKASMGVCVKRMIHGEVAGVMFTRHPITGDPKEIFIIPNYKDGESVESALENPNTIVVERYLRRALRIKPIVKKWQKIIPIIDDESEDDETNSSISNGLALNLALIGLKLDRTYEASRDIEWVATEGQIYVLQCRPIAGSDIQSERKMLTESNEDETLPMVMTPSTSSNVANGNFSSQPEDDISKENIIFDNSKCFFDYAAESCKFEREKFV